MALTFDHGRAVPLRADLFDGIQALLSDLTGPDTGPTTEFGPVLREVARFPFEMSRLQQTVEGIELFRDIVGALAVPGAGVYIGARERNQEQGINPLRISEEFTVFVYLVDGHDAGTIVGRYEPDNVTDQKPGLDAMEDLVVSRLHANAPSGWMEFAYLGIRDLWAEPSFSVREIQLTIATEYRLCHPRNPEQIDELVVNHDVEDGGIIATQKRIVV